MKLLTLAHYLEAQRIIQEYALKETSQGIFESADFILILTGEGPFEAATKTSYALGKFPITEVINLGIAGSLDTNFEPGEAVIVRSLYLTNEGRPFFKTFHTGTEGIDCITSFERILSPEKTTILKGLGKIVDREAWGVAMASKNANIPLQVIKVISDVAGTLGACELVKSKAEHFSEILYHKLQELLKIKVETETTSAIPGIHLTFSMKHKFQMLLNKLSIKSEEGHEETIKSLNLEDILSLEKSPKEKALILIERMEHKLDPLKAVLTERRNKLIQEFASLGIKLELDTNWEDPKARVILEAKNDTELNEIIQNLKSLSLDPFSELMNGDFHVE